MNLLPLQSISRKKVYLYNIIFGRQREASFLIDSKHYDFSFTFLSPTYQPTVFFKIKFSDHILWLSLESLPPLAYFSEKFENIDLSSLPQDIQTIFLESCFEKVVNAIEDALEVVLSIEEYTNTPPTNSYDNVLPFVVRIEGLAQRVYGCFHMTTPAVEFLSAILERTSYVKSNRFTSVEIPLYAIIAEETLSLAEFKNLELRDIILLNDDSFVSNGSCKVVIGDHLVYAGILKNKTLTLESLMEERVDNDNLHDDLSTEMAHEELPEALPEREHLEEMSSNSDFEEEGSEFEEETPAAVLPRELDDVQVTLAFEVGQKRIPLKELQTLKRGFTFELDNSIERPITIRANGRIIGVGELLQVDGRIGVRITSFSKK